MMREILVVNPRKVKKKMPKKKGRKKGKRKSYKNPRVGAKKVAKRAASYAARSFMGLNFRTALKNIPATQAGMFAAKWAAKRFDPDATETDPGTWNWSSYVKGALGAVAAGALVNMLKAGQGQKALEGGMNLMVYKAIQNELIAGSNWATQQFGADDWTDLGTDSYVPTEYLLTGTDDEPYAYDDYGNPYPADDRHRLPEISEMEGALEPVGPLGSALEPVGPLGKDPWAKAFVG